jgi:anti-anti-sigma factor
MRELVAPRPSGTLVEDDQPPRRGADAGTREPSRSAISISRALSRVIVTLRGALDARAALRLRPLLWDLIDGQGNLDVVIDLRDVVVIDPAGIGLLVGTSERMHQHGGRIEFSGVHLGARTALVHFGLTVARTGPDRHEEGEARP